MGMRGAVPIRLKELSILMMKYGVAFALSRRQIGEAAGSLKEPVLRQLRLPVISDLDHCGPGDFGRLSVILDGDVGRCAVKSKSDGDFGRCAVNSDAAVNSDGDFGRCAVNSDA